MIDNRFQRPHFLVFIFLMTTMTVLVGLLFSQYRFFCVQAQELIALKQHYYKLVDEVEQKFQMRAVEGNHAVVDVILSDTPIAESTMTDAELLLAQVSDDPDDDDEYLSDDMQMEKSDNLLTNIDLNQWSHDNVSPVVISVEEKKQPQKQQQVAKKPIKDCGLSWPIDKDKFWLSSLYGPRKRINGTWGFHHGIDMAAVKGTVAKAARDGKVVEAHFQSGYGNTVVIQHTPYLKTRYAHLNSIRVRAGQMVKCGMIVGIVGETGFIRKKGKDGSHLHFEVYEHGKRINPLHCLP